MADSCQRVILPRSLDPCDPCQILKRSEHCSGSGKSFRHEPEFLVRYAPPSPYPPKVVLPSNTGGYRPNDNAENQKQAEDVCKIPGEFDSRLCLQTIEQILKGPELQWEEMGEDVLTIWSIYLRSSPTGLTLSDVDLMSHILMQIAINYPSLSYANEFLALIHAQLASGLRIKRTSDIADFKRLAYAFTIIGEAVCAGDPSAQAKILDILSLWLDIVAGRKRCERRRVCRRSCGDVREMTRPLPAAMFIQSLELSRLPRLLGNFVKDGAYTSAYCNFLHVLRRCCDCSDLIRSRLLKKPLLDPLLLKLCLPDPGNRILSRTVDFIHSLFGRQIADVVVEVVDTPSPHEGTFQVLLTRLFLQLTEFSSQNELHMRNDTAFLVCLLATKIPSLRRNFGRYSQAMGAIVSSNIFGVGGGLQIPYLVDSTLQDVEFFTFLVWMLDLVLTSGSSLHIIEEYQLVPSFIAVLMGPSKLIDAMSKATSIEVLESVVWSALITIAQKSPKAFLVKEGVPAMMEYLKVFNELGSCNSPRLVSMFIHLFRTLLSHGADSAPEETLHFFYEREAMAVFVDTIIRLTTKNCSDAEEPMLSNTLLCCAGLGQFGMQEKEDFLNSNGVRVLTRLVRQLLYHPANERHMDPVLHIAIGECVLKCIADSPSCLETFLGHEGLLRMLDLLEIGAGPPSSLHLLNCVLELCEYPRCMDQLLVWSRRQRNLSQRFVFGDGLRLSESCLPNAIKPRMGETMRDMVTDNDNNLSALLCQLWREEERRLGVLRDSDGCISSIEWPLLSEFGRRYERPEGKSYWLQKTSPGPACLDLLGSIRPKIYLLAKKITEAVNTEAQLFDGLGLQNQLTMQIIINFLDLKRGEIWLEMLQRVKDDKFDLVPSDAEVINCLSTISKNKTSAVLDTQRYLIQRSKENDEIQELEFYKVIQKCHLQDHLKALREADLMARTTSYEYLVERRLWQKTELQKALTKAPTFARMHRTTDGPLNITVWPTRTKVVDSEINQLEGGDSGDKDTPTKQDQAVVVVASSTRTSFDISESVASSVMSMGTFNVGDPADHFPLLPSAATLTDMDATPPSVEGGFYIVSAEALRKALQVLLAKDKKKNWLKRVNDENYWRVRAKWKQDWYPEENLTRTAYKI